MADYVIPDPEPKEIDEKLAIELRHLADNAVLKGQPQGEEQCDNCLYYLENTAEISYCWHPKLRILVGADWWCQWWEKIPDWHRRRLPSMTERVPKYRVVVWGTGNAGRPALRAVAAHADLELVGVGVSNPDKV